MSVAAAKTELSLKCSYGKENRRFHFPRAALTHRLLLEKLSDQYGFNVSISYVNDEGARVELQSQYEMDMALITYDRTATEAAEKADRSEPPPLRIRVEKSTAQAALLPVSVATDVKRVSSFVAEEKTPPPSPVRQTHHARAFSDGGLGFVSNTSSLDSSMGHYTDVLSMGSTTGPSLIGSRSQGGVAMPVTDGFHADSDDDGNASSPEPGCLPASRRPLSTGALSSSTESPSTPLSPSLNTPNGSRQQQLQTTNASQHYSRILSPVSLSPVRSHFVAEHSLPYQRDFPNMYHRHPPAPTSPQHYQHQQQTTTTYADYAVPNGAVPIIKKPVLSFRHSTPADDDRRRGFVVRPAHHQNAGPPQQSSTATATANTPGVGGGVFSGAPHPELVTSPVFLASSVSSTSASTPTTAFPSPPPTQQPQPQQQQQQQQQQQPQSIAASSPPKDPTPPTRAKTISTAPSSPFPSNAPSVTTSPPSTQRSSFNSNTSSFVSAAVASGTAVPLGEFRKRSRTCPDSVLSKVQKRPTRDELDRVGQPKRWKLGVLLGQGGFGKVYVCYDLDRGTQLAVKQVDLQNINGSHSAKHDREMQNLEEEIEVMKALKHEHIVHYYGTERTESALSIFMEFVSGNSIAYRLKACGAFSESVTRNYTRQLIEALIYLHENRVVHRDIKGANILVEKTGLVKLADFGASKRLLSIIQDSNFLKSHVGTPYWMAPEVVNGEGHGRKSDVWSLAATVLEMLTGRPPFGHLEPMAAIFRIGSTTTPPPIPSDISPTARSFMLSCFVRAPTERPGPELLIQHAFVPDFCPFH